MVHVDNVVPVRPEMPLEEGVKEEQLPLQHQHLFILHHQFIPLHQFNQFITHLNIITLPLLTYHNAAVENI